MRGKSLLVFICAVCCAVYADDIEDIDQWLDSLDNKPSQSQSNLQQESYQLENSESQLNEYSNNTTNADGNIEVWLEGVDDDTYSEASFKEEESIRKWAWDLPTYSKLYPWLGTVPWLEPNGVADITVIGSRKREIDNSDTYGASVFASFRPFALDFGSYSFAFGLSFVGRIGRVEDVGKAFNAEAFDEFVVADITVNGGQNHVNQLFVNFSILGSFPEWGLQIMLDLGFGRSNLRNTFEEARGEVQLLGIPIVDALYENYQYKQNDEALFGGFNILKSFDRQYLNFFRLFVYGVYRLNTKTRDSSATLTDEILGIEFGKQDLAFDDLANTGNFFPDPAFPDEFNMSYFGVDLTARLWTFYTPFMKNRGISLNAVGGIRHVSGQLLIEDFHGLHSELGGEIGIFDAINFRVVAVFEEGNQQEDGYAFSLTVQLSAIMREIYKATQ
ncbi:hypothetical protein [Candidatus Uabimicrobium amorphum]|uniref:Secreted protein n=1 Tax=Uabimicrobium amorphum TaxID=2596890 RepID=A0A5S9F2D6_UABAM|nr:hypothetical protein [Candidatus Uabimicrobium amorphum]BBM83555.1 hypothetical protein UABAM_01908 [Candidatus Uabimicrobium amorphum]